MKKTIVITGVTSGIGEAATFKIAEKGYKMILVARSKEKGNELVKRLKEKHPNSDYFFYQGDFSTIKESKEVAQKILKDFNEIDVILNNAGGVFSSFKLNNEGFEQSIATNHLGYFAFTLTLLPILNTTHGRIVNVASNSHVKSTIDFESFTTDKKYFIMRAYGQSKLANIMFTYSLVDKLNHTGITVNTLHPGRVRTNIGIKAKSLFHRFAWWYSSRIAGGITVDEGSRTHVYLATDTAMERITGKYFDNMVEKKSNEESYNKEIQEKLWKWSEEATGLSWSDVKLKEIASSVH